MSREEAGLVLQSLVRSDVPKSRNTNGAKLEETTKPVNADLKFGERRLCASSAAAHRSMPLRTQRHKALQTDIESAHARRVCCRH